MRGAVVHRRRRREILVRHGGVRGYEGKEGERRPQRKEERRRGLRPKVRFGAFKHSFAIPYIPFDLTTFKTKQNVELVIIHQIQSI